MHRLSLAIVLIVASIPALAQDKLTVRVVDVGAGLCCVVEMPGDHYMIYDAGNYTDSGPKRSTRSPTSSRPIPRST